MHVEIVQDPQGIGGDGVDEPHRKHVTPAVRVNAAEAKSATDRAAPDVLKAYLARPWRAWYAKGAPDHVDIPLQSVPEAFDAACATRPDQVALIFFGRELRYRELREATDRFANALATLGIRKGDRVALYLLNSPQFVIAYFGVLKAGAVVTPISPVYTSHEVRHQLEDSGARAMVCQDIL
ncbi:MAG: long-chain fatty acid--CoA ligase, partial [Betaproteobacteria bacterium]|nr:long-chain fatty acid--CoA ligase [Betaproteobacteria bacterium]